jgi:hypothetical protein
VNHSRFDIIHSVTNRPAPVQTRFTDSPVRTSSAGSSDGLLSKRDGQTVSKHLAGVGHPVTPLFFAQTIGAPETSAIMQQLLDELASLSHTIRLTNSTFVTRFTP